MILQKISVVPDVENAAIADDTLLSTSPQRNIFFLPYISEALPTGTRKAAAERRYAVATQLSEMASIARSDPMRGNATVTGEEVKGPRKELSTAANSAFLLRLV